MRNFIQSGDTITLHAPYDTTSGSGVLVGSIFGIACNDALVGTEVELKLTGVFNMLKVVTETWAPGTLVYWSEATKLVTSEPKDNYLIGVAIHASSNPSSTGTVRLNGALC